MTGAEAVIRSLEAEGVEHLRGIPGGAILPLYDACMLEHTVHHVLVRHEQGAGHMAEGYARATGKVGVCMATSGPGATNLVTGRRRVPGLDPARRHHRPGADAPDRHRRLPGGRHHRHHHADHQAQLPRAPTRPTSRAIIKEAFHIARTGRPGPVLIDIPKDVAPDATLDFNYPETVDLPGYKPTAQGHPLQIQAAAEAIAKAQPAGALRRAAASLIAEADDELRAFAEKARHPGRDDADGQRRLPGLAPALPRHARHARLGYANWAIEPAPTC